jgi:hypothetical protein
VKAFRLVRAVDVSGVSGTGVVAEGIRFTDGAVAMRWCVADMPPSTTVWARLEDMLRVHGHSGTTFVDWEE